MPLTRGKERMEIHDIVNFIVYGLCEILLYSLLAFRITGGIRTGPRHNDQSAARKRRGAEAVTRPSTTQAPRTDDRWILERVRGPSVTF